MSLKTWRAEFYPVEADDVDEEDALEHSIRKWKGLRKKNRQKHEVELDCLSLYGLDGGRLIIAAESCALCVYYADESCEGCPLQEHLGEACDADGQPYQSFQKNGAVEPMIEALKKCR